MSAYTNIEDIEQYICELVEKLQNEKDLTLKHLFFLIKTTDVKAARKDRLIGKCKRKLNKLENELLDILWFHNVRVLTDDDDDGGGGGELLLRNIKEDDGGKVIKLYLQNKTKKTGPNTLEVLLQIQKKINSVYQDLVDINMMKAR